jgi:hypothetical protein
MELFELISCAARATSLQAFKFSGVRKIVFGIPVVPDEEMVTPVFIASFRWSKLSLRAMPLRFCSAHIELKIGFMQNKRICPNQEVQCDTLSQMDKNDVLIAEVLEDPSSQDVQLFFAECLTLGFTNNSSTESIKFRWATEERRGRFWVLRHQGAVVAMAGCHWIPEIHQKAFRIQFRGCEIPGTDVKKTLSRGQFNSSTFRELIPFQLSWIHEQGDYEVFLSVGLGHRNHRSMEILEKQGFLEFYERGNLFDTPQTTWKFNVEHYQKVRSKIRTYACMKA